MKIKMLVQTVHKGKSIFPDEILDVDNVTAKRWAKNKIAELLEEADTANVEVQEELDETTEEVAKADEELQLSQMSPKELYNFCLSKGIKAEAKKQASYYIDLLKKSEEVEAQAE